ncbi:NACHT domain-containing protein [Streptomyces sp. P17]|uniref:NACHT domain-containing protein n=1 Tax=Streptomyces sp. P17 TaxID=3074716 RepID=UPI0028F3F256|nr:NACHT domain-containing protein [Streptomyces sp. P17]MDT9697747.1 NACHT domain-containing protein [Streptomyces sp. P17]
MRGDSDFDQPAWQPDTVINAGVYQAIQQPAQAVSPPPSDDPQFRRALARLLLRKLTSTLDEIHWLDDELVELTAIVEDVDGYPATRRRGLLRRRGRYATSPLSQALTRPKTDLILLQGQAGSGKSVALRQYATAQLRQIAEGRAPNASLPVYVNLRELHAKPHEITTEVLRRYIMEQTGPRGSADIAAYFTHCFADDLRERKVTLLLDSFDEIPAVLGSATVDAVVAPYVQTVIELVGGGGRCVVASREYKGLRANGWTRLHILGLSPQQQEDFLRRVGLDQHGLALLQPLLTDPRRGFTAEAQNPLSLKLLATYVQAHQALPDRPSTLFADYAALRLRAVLTGAQDVQRRLEDFLARFAFRLTASGGGLSVDERSHQDDLVKVAEEDPGTRVLLIRALSESRILVSSGRRVFFGHRRVQQYFASKYVADHPDAVPPHELATNGRWRETAVTVLQDGAPEATEPLLGALAEVLAAERSDGAVFEWSRAAVHCLELLTAAYQGRPQWPYETVRPLVETLVATAWERGSVSDRKFALDCLPLLSEEARELYIDRAFAGESGWLRTTALRDCATLPTLSPAIRGCIRRLLITMLGQKVSPAEAHAIKADLQRLRGDEDLVRVRRVVERVPVGVVVLSTAYYVVGSAAWDPVLDPWTLVAPVFYFLLPLTLFWFFQSTQPLSYGAYKGRFRRLVEDLLRRWTDTEADKAETNSCLTAISGLAVAVMVIHLMAAGVALSMPDRAAVAVGAVLSLPLAALALLWGPSTLYVVRHNCSGENLGAAGLARMPFTAVRVEEHPIRGMFNGPWLTRALRSLRRRGLGIITAVATGGALIYLTLRFEIVLLICLVPAAVGVVSLIADLVRALLRDLLSRRRVSRAAERGSAGGPAFFSALAELRDTAEAAEYVRLVRGIPRAEPLALDRQALRRYIAGLPETDSELLDQLGRLDEQLRTR